MTITASDYYLRVICCDGEDVRKVVGQFEVSAILSWGSLDTNRLKGESRFNLCSWPCSDLDYVILSVADLAEKYAPPTPSLLLCEVSGSNQIGDVDQN